MRRFLGAVLVNFLAVVISSSAFAHDGESGMIGKEMGMDMMKKGTIGEKGMMAMCPMREAMMEMMTGKSLVATEDGGVVLLLGNKLIKYDKKLKLVNETKVKIDTEGISKMMKEMKEKCPMHKKMMQGGGMIEKGGMIGAGNSEEPIDHESHH